MVLAMFNGMDSNLFESPFIVPVAGCFMVLGIAAIVCACGAAAIRFSVKHKREEQALYDAAVAQRMSSSMAVVA